MSSRMEEQATTICNTEYDSLKRVILCQPKYMAIEDVINDVQKQYKDENIDVDLAMKQHTEFERLLREHGVEVIKLPTSEKFPEQVFTRDIGFTVGEEVFVAEMASDIRKGEEVALEEFLDEESEIFIRLALSKLDQNSQIIQSMIKDERIEPNFATS